MTESSRLDELYRRVQGLGTADADTVDRLSRVKSALSEGGLELKDTAWAVKLMLDWIVSATSVDPVLSGFCGKHDGGWTADADIRYWAVPIVAANLALFLEEQGGENYASIRFGVGESDRHFDLTLRWAGAQTPAEKAAALEVEVKALRSQLASLVSGQEGGGNAR